MKHYYIIVFVFLISLSYSQIEKSTKQEAEAVSSTNATYEFERKFDVFIAAGISQRFGSNYNVAISPIDQTVQFEKSSPLSSGISTGLNWQPFSYYKRQNVRHKPFES